jgi:hypothetical protein
VEVNDTWKLFTRSDMGLEVTTLKFLASLIDKLNVISFYLEAIALKTFGTWISELGYQAYHPCTGLEVVG